MGFPLHKAYPYRKNIGFRTSIWMIPEMFGEPIADHAPTEVPTNSVEDRRRCFFLPVRLWEDLTWVTVCWGKVQFCFRVKFMFSGKLTGKQGGLF